ncbi:hypothetical protein MA16_Dca004741 [Dendrobium catenatum]|uniref:Uncharacterized protein n=1 Tax=Dendrobium catenatum TaxID=906689 RepID=A0A2I0VNY9_9ASPA|nr:hypothetical protein MA16_Dca004741 [Dendrobium catenatum]
MHVVVQTFLNLLKSMSKNTETKDESNGDHQKNQKQTAAASLTRTTHLLVRGLPEFGAERQRDQKEVMDSVAVRRECL